MAFPTRFVGLARLQTLMFLICSETGMQAALPGGSRAAAGDRFGPLQRGIVWAGSATAGGGRRSPADHRVI